MPSLYFALPGSIDTRTGGTIYDKRILAELRALGWDVTLAQWPARFPFPSEDDRATVLADLDALPDGSLALIDGLAFGVLAEELAVHAARLRLVALVHHPLALETGLSPDQQAALADAERLALSHARHVIVTSRTTAETLVADYAVPADRITIAHPGTDRPDTVPKRPIDGPLKLLAVGTVSPRKGFDMLVAALGGLSDLAWECRIAGSLVRDLPAAEALRRQIDAAGLGTRISLLGEVSEMAPLYADAQLFVLPSRHEGYGMAFAEALGQGLPVIGCRAGAVPEVVPADAGILVEPDDVAGLAQALRRVMTEPAVRDILATGAARARDGLARWADSARRVETALLAV